MRTERKSLASITRWISLACGAIVSVVFLAGCSDGTARTESSSLPPAVPAVNVSVPTTPDLPKADESLRTELPGFPADPAQLAAAWREGTALYEKGSYREAARRLEVAATGRPNDAYVHYVLGLSLWKSGEMERAETALVRSAELNDKSARTWVNLARVRMDRVEAKGALEASEKALELDPDSANGMHQRGRALAALGRKEEAIETLGKARQSDPENGHVANTLGWLLLQSGQAAEAVPHLEAAAVKLPGVAYVRNNLGVAYERTGRIEEAAREYQAAVDAGDPDGKAGQSLLRLAPRLPKTSLRLPEMRCEDEMFDLAQAEGENATEEN